MREHKGSCPVCTYEFPADLADVAISRHAPSHTADEWVRAVKGVRPSMRTAEERYAHVARDLQDQLATVEQWATAASDAR